MPKPPRSFANPDVELTLYSPGDNPIILKENLPAIIARDLDEEVRRRLGGIPFPAGHSRLYAPLDLDAQAAGYALEHDLRTGQIRPMDVVEVDTDPDLWTMTLLLTERQLLIGQH